MANKDNAYENRQQGKCEVEPIPFCCFVTIPEGFEPVVDMEERDIICSTIIKDCTNISEGTLLVENVEIDTGACGVIVCNLLLPTANLSGCLEVQNALKIKKIDNNIDEECDCDCTFVCCRTCVCLEEQRLCVCCPQTDISCAAEVDFVIDKESLDAEFVGICEECCQDQVWRITGLIIIDFQCDSNNNCKC